jgi:hypothetical protein
MEAEPCPCRLRHSLDWRWPRAVAMHEQVRLGMLQVATPDKRLAVLVPSTPSQHKAAVGSLTSSYAP